MAGLQGVRMPPKRRVNVEVSERLLSELDARVAGGEFESRDDAISAILIDDSIARQYESFDEEVMRRVRELPPGATDADAVRLRREIHERRHRELVSLIQEGIDDIERGDVVEWNLEEFLADRRRRHTDAQTPSKRESA